MVKIEKFFDARGNAEATLKDIGAGTGVPIATIRANLYKSNVDKFERRSEEGFGKPSWFKMKQ